MSCQRVIFIVGVEHSGTTILYRMLAQHSDMAWFSQYSMRGGLIPGRTRLPLYGVVNKLGRKFFPISWKKKYSRNKRHSNKPGLMPTPMEPHAIWNYLLPTQDASQFFSKTDANASVVLRMRQICFTECQEWEKKCLLVKLPRLSQAVKLLAHTFPEALFVHITRDGRAVALSTARKFDRHGESKDEALKNSALHWKRVEEYLDEAQKVDGNRFIACSYESFCADVHTSVKGILDFVGLPHYDRFIERLPRQLSVTNEKWFSELSREEKILLNTTLQPTLAKRGYAPFNL